MNILKTKAQFDILSASDKVSILTFLHGEFTEEFVMIKLENNGSLNSVYDLSDYEVAQCVTTKQNWIDKDILLYTLTGYTTLALGI